MKYISYSLWGDNKVYTYGIVENVLDAKKFYEGWIVRVHYNDTVPQNIIDWLKKQDNVELVHHPGDKDERLQIALWRFEDLFIKDATTFCAAMRIPEFLRERSGTVYTSG